MLSLCVQRDGCGFYGFLLFFRKSFIDLPFLNGLFVSVFIRWGSHAQGLIGLAKISRGVDKRFSLKKFLSLR